MKPTTSWGVAGCSPWTAAPSINEANSDASPSLTVLESTAVSTASRSPSPRWQALTAVSATNMEMENLVINPLFPYLPEATARRAPSRDVAGTHTWHLEVPPFPDPALPIGTSRYRPPTAVNGQVWRIPTTDLRPVAAAPAARQRSAMSAGRRYGDASTMAAADHPWLVPLPSWAQSPSVWTASRWPPLLST